MTVPREGIAESQKTHERRKWEGPWGAEGAREGERLLKRVATSTILLRDVNLCLFVRALRRSVRRDTKVRKLLANK